MSYFVSREELLSEIAKAVDAVFSAVARMFSEKDEELKGKLKELESNFLLLINTVGYKSYQSKNKNRRKNMEEPRAVRPFEEVLEDVVNHVLDSEDHELILLIDELEESAKEGKEMKEKMKKALRESFRRAKALIKEHEESEKKEEKTG